MKFGPLTAIVLTVVFAATLATIRTRLEATTASAAEPHITFDDQFVSYFCFHRTLNNTIELLASGQIRLAEACDRVHESAVHHNPDYLRHIEYSDAAPTVQERIARNLIGHVHCIAGNDLALSDRVLALQVELAVLH